MITTTVEKLPKICRSCVRLRCKSKHYSCKANLIFPKKPTCGRYKEHIKARFKRFLVDNLAFDNWTKNRKSPHFRNKLNNPHMVLVDSFIWTSSRESFEYWSKLNKKWQEIIKTEYHEHLPKG